MAAWIKVQDLFLPLTLLSFIACSPITETKPGSEIEATDLPKWTWPILTNNSFQEKYDFHLTINPFYLQADFDKDDFLDLAVLIKDKASDKIGVALLRYSENQVTIFGAGEKTSFGGDNWEWLHTWKTESVLPAGSGVQPAGAVLILIPQDKNQNAPWLFWSGRKWQWKNE